jgi:hypothetical protein
MAHGAEVHSHRMVGNAVLTQDLRVPDVVGSA